MERPDETTHFGFLDVELRDKQDLCPAARPGLGRGRMPPAQTPPRDDTPFALLDVAGGTGDISFRAAEAAGNGFHATVCDINTDMLAVGRERAEAQHLDDRVDFVEGNAESLGFPDRNFDAYTIAFGIRNVPRIPLALAEAYRVL